MSSAPGMAPMDLKSLEQTRQRLAQLTSSLDALRQSLNQADPLPSWSSLQSSLNIISQHMGTLATHLAAHGPALAAFAAVPLPTFPGREHEALLTQLLRKKLEPRVEDWAAAGRREATRATDARDDGTQGTETLRQLWAWAGPEANELARSHRLGGRYTQAERDAGIEHVVTGLRRPMPSADEEDEDEDEDEADEMDVDGVGSRRGSLQEKAPAVVMPALSLSDHLRYLSTGTLPNG